MHIPHHKPCCIYKVVRYLQHTSKNLPSDSTQHHFGYTTVAGTDINYANSSLGTKSTNKLLQCTQFILTAALKSTTDIRNSGDYTAYRHTDNGHCAFL